MILAMFSIGSSKFAKRNALLSLTVDVLLYIQVAGLLRTSHTHIVTASLTSTVKQISKTLGPVRILNSTGLVQVLYSMVTIPLTWLLLSRPAILKTQMTLSSLRISVARGKHYIVANSQKAYVALL